MADGILPSHLTAASALGVGLGMYSSALPRHVKESIFEYKYEPKKDFLPLKKRKQKLIRVFISSTFEDMQLERDHFTAHIYPRIEAYCQSKGWNFLTVDLRWGIRDESTDDHKTTIICQEEIQRCQEISPGANFVLLLGNRAGWRPLPPYIPLSEYNNLRSHCTHQALLDKWYIPDLNAKPEPLYCLTPLNNSNRNEFWREVCPALIPDIHQAIRRIRDTGKLPWERFAHYFASVTENEVMSGILNSAADHKAVVCLRNIKNYDPNAPNAHKFANLITRPSGERGVDEEAWQLVIDLKARLKQMVAADRLFEYEADWTGDGITNAHIEKQGEDLEKAVTHIIDAEMNRYVEVEAGEHEQEVHMEFAARLSHFFVGRVSECKLLSSAFPHSSPDAAFQALPWRDDEKPKFEDGSADFQAFSDNFVKRNLFKSAPVSASTESGSAAAPAPATAGHVYVVTGVEGVGKKTLLAHMAMKHSEEKEKEQGRIVVFRAFDITESSSHGTQLLIDVYLCIFRALRGDADYLKEAHRVHTTDKFQNHQGVVSHWMVMTALNELLHRVPPSRPLTLLFTGVRDSFFDYGGELINQYDYAWIPNPLPSHINIIFAGAGSVIPASLSAFLEGKHFEHIESILREKLSGVSDEEREATLKQQIAAFIPAKFETVTVKLGLLTNSEVESLLDRSLLAIGRALTAPQRRYAVDHIMKMNSALPGVVEMVSNHVSTWRSSNPNTLQENLPSSLEQGVHMFLAKAEKYHGALLVGRTLCYICLARDGISEAELRQVLTIDADVVKDVSQYHTAKELPAIVWSRLFLDVQPFLNEQNGKLKPRLPALIRVVRMRYLSLTTVTALEMALHRRLALINLIIAQPSKALALWQQQQLLANKEGDKTSTSTVPTSTATSSSSSSSSTSSTETKTDSSSSSAPPSSSSSSSSSDATTTDNTNATTQSSSSSSSSSSTPEKDVHPWKDDQDWRAPERVLKNIIYHLRLAQQWAPLDHMLTDILLHERLFSRDQMSALISEALTDVIVHCGHGSYKDKLPRLYQFCLYLTTPVELGRYGVQEYQPWEPLPENTPPSDLQFLTSFRLRGSDVCHYDDNQWYCFERRYMPVNGFVHLVQPFIWRRGQAQQAHGGAQFRRKDKFQLEQLSKAMSPNKSVAKPLMRHDQFIPTPYPSALRIYSWSPNWGIGLLRTAANRADVLKEQQLKEQAQKEKDKAAKQAAAAAAAATAAASSSSSSSSTTTGDDKSKQAAS